MKQRIGRLFLSDSGSLNTKVPLALGPGLLHWISVVIFMTGLI